MKKSLLFISFVIFILLFIYYLKPILPLNLNKNTKDNIHLRIAYFPNITHAPIIIGLAKGIFQKHLGNNVVLETKIFNAGPSEIEALFAGEVDIGYIGPGPAINGYIKSRGRALKIISGSTSGGASLIVKSYLSDLYKLKGLIALKNIKVASPQLGNTQDLSLRHFIKVNKLSDIKIIPITNADQITIFTKNEIDAAWAPEPWATRLVRESGGIRLIDERDLWKDKSFSTTNIIANTKIIQNRPDLVKKFITAHLEVIDWINTHPEEAQTLANTEVAKLTSGKLSGEVIKEAWQMLNFTPDPIILSVQTFAKWAIDEGFIEEKNSDLDNLFFLNILNETANSKY